MALLLDILLDLKYEVSIENPARSIVFYHPAFAKVIAKHCLIFVLIDQCCYGLSSPPGADVDEIWRKPTDFVTSNARLSSVACQCSASHKHTHIQGSIRVHGRCTNRSMLAGRYPVRLCNAVAKCFAQGTS